MSRYLKKINSKRTGFCLFKSKNVPGKLFSRRVFSSYIQYIYLLTFLSNYPSCLSFPSLLQNLFFLLSFLTISSSSLNPFFTFRTAFHLLFFFHSSFVNFLADLPYSPSFLILLIFMFECVRI